VDGGGIGGNQRVKLAEAVVHRAPVEARHDFARLEIDVDDIADVAVVARCGSSIRLPVSWIAGLGRCELRPVSQLVATRSRRAASLLGPDDVAARRLERRDLQVEALLDGAGSRVADFGGHVVLSV
jgi:hypothetical protein